MTLSPDHEADLLALMFAWAEYRAMDVATTPVEDIMDYALSLADAETAFEARGIPADLIAACRERPGARVH